MNERIKELAEQAGARTKDVCYGHGEYHDEFQLINDDIEKFAELIIKECINSIGDENSLHASTIYIRTLAEHRINKCFGIEE